MQAAQQLAALQQRAVRSAEKQWQLPDGCGMAASAAVHVERLIACGRLKVMTPRSCTHQLALPDRHL